MLLIILMKDKQPLLLPIYEALGKDQPDRIEDLFLTPNDMVDQIHNLMLEFRKMEEKGQLPDVIFLLDRGAAILEQPVRALFTFYCTQEVSPIILHINIGRSTVGKHGTNIPFNGNPDILKSSYKDQLPADPKRILILDDYIRSGKTIQKAKFIFQRAFPNINISTLAAFTKIPKWQGRSDYTGLEEYTSNDYSNLALDKLNDEIGSKKLHFDSVGDLIRAISDENRWLSFRFYEIKREISGNIPYAKKVNNEAIPQEKIVAEIESLCSAVINKYSLH